MGFMKIPVISSPMNSSHSQSWELLESFPGISRPGSYWKPFQDLGTLPAPGAASSIWKRRQDLEGMGDCGRTGSSWKFWVSVGEMGVCERVGRMWGRRENMYVWGDIPIYGGVLGFRGVCMMSTGALARITTGEGLKAWEHRLRPLKTPPVGKGVYRVIGSSAT